MRKPSKKRPVFALGLMSGTSVDAIDASLVQIEDSEDHLLLHLQFPFEEKLREEILALIREPSLSLSNFTKLHYEIGAAFADAATETMKAAKQKKFLSTKAPLDVIGSHGQTVFHDPEGKRTLQIGETNLIAARTGVTAVGDFRPADTAYGGEGAPLLPFYHKRLFAKEARKGVVVHNLGGISNFTYVGPKNTIFALDTGPANCLIDGAIQKISQGKKKFDENGNLARSGKVSTELLSYLRGYPPIEEFRKKRAPKSTGRELFSPKFLDHAMKQFSHLHLEDLLHTLTHFTTTLILECYEAEITKKKLPFAHVVFAGGGAQNTFLVSILESALPKVNFSIMEDWAWNSQALESQAFGYFAFAALAGLPITFPSTTGTGRPAVCGKIIPGDNWAKLWK